MPVPRPHSRALGALARGALLALALPLAALPTACRTAGARGPQGEQAEPTTVRIQNRSFLDVTVYVLVNGARQRLGQAGGNRDTTLRIPSNLLFGVTTLAFIIDPIGAPRQPRTESITVSPGDEVVLLVPPNF